MCPSPGNARPLHFGFCAVPELFELAEGSIRFLRQPSRPNAPRPVGIMAAQPAVLSGGGLILSSLVLSMKSASFRQAAAMSSYMRFICAS